MVTVICKVGHYRERMEMTQRELAAFAGTGSSTICEIESGKRLPNVILAIKIARILQTTVENLWEEKEMTTKKPRQKQGRLNEQQKKKQYPESD